MTLQQLRYAVIILFVLMVLQMGWLMALLFGTIRRVHAIEMNVDMLYFIEEQQ